MAKELGLDEQHVVGRRVCTMCKGEVLVKMACNSKTSLPYVGQCTNCKTWTEYGHPGQPVEFDSSELSI